MEAHGSIDVTQGREVLPKNVKPLHYHVTMEPDLEKLTYEGKVVIEWVPVARSFCLRLTILPALMSWKRRRQSR